jgi:hypothetical protein
MFDAVAIGAQVFATYFVVIRTVRTELLNVQGSFFILSKLDQTRNISIMDLYDMKIIPPVVPFLFYFFAELITAVISCRRKCT